MCLYPADHAGGSAIQVVETVKHSLVDPSVDPVVKHELGLEQLVVPLASIFPSVW